MEALLLYVLKSSGLIAAFYLAYHFLVRKETFFDGNRWFLLSGLVTSVLLPLCFIKKIILVERPPISVEELVALSKQTYHNTTEIAAVEAFDWMSLVAIGYSLIASVLLLKILLNLVSLYRMLHKQHRFKREGFTLVDLEQNISPFSFFNYIVYNSDFYTDDELQSIVLHEQVHSKELHSIDVLVVKVYCALFWFNPFVWFYKKAITQNLEYIADQKAIQQLDDRYAYQHALLKVVSHQNCLSITNHFYQSLIKKRIVMLNTNQSHKRNSWKYALVLPILLAFVLLFQIKVIAQEKEGATLSSLAHEPNDVRVKIDKNATDEQLKKEAIRLKAEHGVTLKISKVKRNSAGEITCIKVAYKDQNGNKGITQVNGDEPITPIHFYKNSKGVGFGKPKSPRILINTATFTNPIEPNGLALHIDEDSIPEINEAIDLNFEIPENSLGLEDGDKNVIINRRDKKPLIIINGKTISDDGDIENILKGNNFSFSFDDNEEDTDNPKIIINGKEIMKLRDEAMEDAKVQIKRMRPMIQKQVRMVNSDRKRAKEEMERAQADIEKAQAEADAAKPEMDKARAEMIKAKEEMMRAKDEMLKAKAALEKERANLKKRSTK